VHRRTITAPGTKPGFQARGRISRRSGVAIFREAYGRIGLGWLLAPTGWPLVRPRSDLGYRWFARNRIRIEGWFGRTCGPDGTGRIPDRKIP